MIIINFMDEQLLLGIVKGLQYRFKDVETELKDLKNELLMIRVGIYDNDIQQATKELQKMIQEDKMRCWE